ncbi:hypothetical protein FB004_102485 [Sinorhizobium medicae]|nr:hypothetical protein FB006_104154 [Sinorhizobium medicae]TWA27509.1 hypothetical protein FB004_102485 [Sinorhizobium medicae]TWA35305.1 hypothetical protein FB007_106154 [Sinorhizobium medicae]TWA43418.1 hypothetical protein FB009_102185 [Sinorhizobium medicae]TWA45667.1 hypothetical protein FB005_105254 [Sinorhizobium medicae]
MVRGAARPLFATRFLRKAGPKTRAPRDWRVIADDQRVVLDIVEIGSRDSVYE